MLIVAGAGLPPSLMAQTNYENYTLLTFAGPPGSPGWFDGSNSAARFAKPFGAAVDGDGNVYVADSGNHTIRKVSPAGVVTTLAGSAGRSGTNDGVGVAARFFGPKGVAVDTDGNVYVADTSNHAIRKITPAGMVTTLAGSPGSSGTNNGTGRAARFASPNGVAVDASNNVFVADTASHTIRKITPDGVASDFAGLARVSGISNGAGQAARFYNPFGVTVWTNGDVYVADTYNHTIRKITSAGDVSNVAGLAMVSGTNNGTGGDARFNFPTGVAMEGAGNVYVADYFNYVIRRITAAGAVTNVAGLAGNSGSVNGTGGDARFNLPAGVAVAASGNVYVADYNNNLIRKLTPAAEVTTLAGKAGSLGAADGNVTNSLFSFPAGVAVDGSTNFYVADLANHTIRKITAAGAVSTLAGSATVTGTNNGTGGEAGFNTPTGVAVDTNGNVYVADTYNHTIRKITPLGEVSTFAGLAKVSGTNNGAGTAARFNNPFAVAVGLDATVYVADTYNHTIRKITPDGAVTNLAGRLSASGTNDGVGSAARFYFPEGIAVDKFDNVYVADTGNHMIRKITPAGVVTTLAGAPRSSLAFADGAGNNARFFSPFGVAVDEFGNVYVGDYNNGLIRKITPAGVVTTLAGTPGSSGFVDGTGVAARLNTPEGVAVGPDGILYVADASNHAIRKGYAAPPDAPVVDLPIAQPGVVRHLDVTNLTTTEWAWSIVRRPANSSAQLSSTTARNPSFTPDVADMFVLRFEGRDAQGRLNIGTVSVLADATPPTNNITSPTPGQNWSNANFTVTGTAGDNVEVVRVRCQINDGDWTDAVGTTSWTAVMALSPGLNTVRAYAVDVAGNVSDTNSVTFNEVTAPLAVAINGLGTITPNYNGQRLEMGRIYTMTAKAASGFAFINWTGSFTTNSATLSFVMQSNLTFTANFRDIVKPTLIITAPKPGQNWSNANFTATGTANDNRQLAAVWCQLSNSAWVQAVGTTNWSTGLTLVPGPNTLRVFAVDNDGNSSVTNSVTFTYVLSDRLTLAVAGRGGISPNYSNAVLQLGKPYTLTAKPGIGFAFTNWTGSLTTNKAVLTFIMQSNLTFTANFVDTNRPTVTITNPLANARLSNSVVTFGGTARDNFAVDHVEYQLNNGPFQTASGVSNWSATVNLIAGTNVLRVKGIDTTANESLVVSRSVFFVVPSPLTLCTNGSGRVAGATNGQMLEVGRSYKLTATPNTRNLFAIWSGDLSSTNPALTFLMQSNLSVCANFVTNPYVGLKGIYYGLFAETNEVRNHDRSGYFTFTLAEAGTYSASFQLGAKKLSVTGKFDWLGQSWLTLKPAPASNVTVALQLDVTNLNATVAGVLSNQFWWAPLQGYRAPVLGTNASPQMGKYTLVIPGSDNAAASPGGDGYGTVTVSKAGLLTLAGKLGDGTALSQSIPVSSDGWWALYASLYTSKGSVQGWMQFTNETNSDINGPLSWIKPAMPASTYYRLGFTNEPEAVGSKYVAPGTTNRVLNFTNGVAAFTGGNLLQAITNNVLLTTNNKVTNLSSNKLTLTLTLTTGLFTGSVTDTNTGKAITFNGALLQKINSGYGQFLGTNQTGNVYFGQ